MTYAGDLCRIQTIYGELDSLSLTVGKLISRRWGIDNEIINLVEKENAHIVALNNNSYVPGEGDPFVYKIWKDYKPLSFDGKTKQLVINRSVVLGYRG